MQSLEYKINHKKNEQLIEAFEKAPDRARETVNKVMHGKGVNAVVKAIFNFMPRSDRKKEHAKGSDSLNQKNTELGFTITTKRKFGYLIFPNEGRGKNNPIAQRFFERGLESKESYLFEETIKALEEVADLRI